MVQQEMPAVFGGLDDPGMELRAQRQCVRAFDAGAAQPVDGDSDNARVAVAVRAELRACVGRRRRNALDTGSDPTVKHGPVLDHGRGVCSTVEVIEVGVACTALDIVDL